MRINIKKIIAVFFAAMFTSTIVFAEVNSEVKVDDANGRIIVSGEFDNSMKDSVNVSIVSGKLDNNSFEALTEDEIYAGLKYIRQLDFESGKFGFDIPFDNPYGWYSVIIKTFDGEKSVTPVFFYRTKDVTDILTSYNGFADYKGTDEEEISRRAKGIFELVCSEENKDTFFGAVKYFFNLNDKEKLNSAKELVFEPTVTLVSEIVNNLDSAAQFINLENMLADKDFDKGAAAAFIENNAGYLKISEYAETKTFANSGSEFKNMVAARLANISAKDFSYRFREAVVLTEIETVENSGMISSILENAEKSMGLDISAYKNYAKKSEINEQIAKKRFLSLEKLKEAIESIAQNPSVPENSSPGKSSSGGSGGSIKSVLDITMDNKENINDDLADKIFKDFDENHWAYNAVYYLKKNGVTNGYDDGTFRPDNSITRAEFLKLSMKAMSFYENTDKAYFSDISPDDYFYGAANAAAKYGIVLGDENGRFNPNEKITREDAAMILYRAAAFSGFVFSQNQTPAFNDEADISEYAVSCVRTFKNCGIIKGDNGFFNPKSSATRAEMCQMIYSLLLKR